MKREILRFEFTCDECGKVEVVDRNEFRKHELPQGWSRREVRDCGMTGYTRSGEVCGNCKEGAAK